MIKDRRYNAECDTWSAGIILFEMVRGYKPFDDITEAAIHKKILEIEPDYTGISKDLTNLLQNLLQKKPSLRVKISNMKNFCCLQQLTYTKFLSNTIENLMLMKEENLVDKELEKSLTPENREVMKHIVFKEKITSLIHCLNHLDFNILESNLLNKKNVENSITRPRTFSNPKLLKQAIQLQGNSNEEKLV